MSLVLERLSFYEFGIAWRHTTRATCMFGIGAFNCFPSRVSFGAAFLSMCLVFTRRKKYNIFKTCTFSRHAPSYVFPLFFLIAIPQKSHYFLSITCKMLEHQKLTKTIRK
jgi:hypothetical protein